MNENEPSRGVGVDGRGEPMRGDPTRKGEKAGRTGVTCTGTGVLATPFSEPAWGPTEGGDGELSRISRAFGIV